MTPAQKKNRACFDCKDRHAGCAVGCERRAAELEAARKEYEQRSRKWNQNNDVLDVLRHGQKKRRR